jgi:hypothetical protein
MRNPNQRLIRTLGLGWLAFLGLGIGLRYALAPSSITVIIDRSDRSYCDANEWQALTAEYASLYEQQTQQRLKINQVIYVSDLGQIVADEIPTPDEFSTLNMFGQFNQAEMNQALQAQPGAKVLSCNISAP